MALLKAWLAGAVTMAILGGLFHGVLAADYFASQLPDGAAMPTAPLPLFFILPVSLIMAYLYPKGFEGGAPGTEGFRFGALIGIIMVLPLNVLFVGMFDVGVGSARPVGPSSATSWTSAGSDRRVLRVLAHQRFIERDADTGSQRYRQDPTRHALRRIDEFAAPADLVPLVLKDIEVGQTSTDLCRCHRADRTAGVMRRDHHAMKLRDGRDLAKLCETATVLHVGHDDIHRPFAAERGEACNAEQELTAGYALADPVLDRLGADEVGWRHRLLIPRQLLRLEYSHRL